MENSVRNIFCDHKLLNLHRSNITAPIVATLQNATWQMTVIKKTLCHDKNNRTEFFTPGLPLITENNESHMFLDNIAKMLWSTLFRILISWIYANIVWIHKKLDISLDVFFKSNNICGLPNRLMLWKDVKRYSEIILYSDLWHPESRDMSPNILTSWRINYYW